MDQLFVTSLKNFFNRNDLKKSPQTDWTPGTRLQTALQKFAKLSNSRDHVGQKTPKRVLPHSLK